MTGTASGMLLGVVDPAGLSPGGRLVGEATGSGRNAREEASGVFAGLLAAACASLSATAQASSEASAEGEADRQGAMDETAGARADAAGREALVSQNPEVHPEGGPVAAEARLPEGEGGATAAPAPCEVATLPAAAAAPAQASVDGAQSGSAPEAASSPSVQTQVTAQAEVPAAPDRRARTGEGQIAASAPTDTAAGAGREASGPVAPEAITPQRSDGGAPAVRVGGVEVTVERDVPFQAPVNEGTPDASAGEASEGGRSVTQGVRPAAGEPAARSSVTASEAESRSSGIAEAEEGKNALLPADAQMAQKAGGDAGTGRAAQAAGQSGQEPQAGTGQASGASQEESGWERLSVPSGDAEEVVLPQDEDLVKPDRSAVEVAEAAARAGEVAQNQERAESGWTEGIPRNAQNAQTDLPRPEGQAETQARPRLELRELPDFVRRAELVVRHGGPQEMRVQLVPESLGRMSVRITLSEGQVTARLVVESAEVKSLVEQRMPELERALRDQGLRLGGLSVGCEDAGARGGFLREQADGRFAGRLSFGAARRVYDEAPVPVATAPAAQLAARHLWNGSGGLFDALA